MNKLLKIVKKLLYPVTLLTIVTILCLIITLQALIIALKYDHTSAIYLAVMVPITLLVFSLYLVDRWLVNKVKYYQLILGEIIIALFIVFSYSKSTSTVDVNFYTDDINFHTNNDFILVLFDVDKNLSPAFSDKKTFGKELNIYNTNIIHIDSTLYQRKDLRINPPTNWKSSSTEYGTINRHGTVINYIYSSKNTFNRNYIKNTDAYIDSLIRNENKK